MRLPLPAAGINAKQRPGTFIFRFTDYTEKTNFRWLEMRRRGIHLRY